MVRDLTKSGIPAEVAADLNWYPVEDGYVIPFHDPATGAPLLCPDGRPFERRRLEHPTAQCKYLSPKNGGLQPYILCDVHQALLDDPASPVVITEGEKKALRATLAGVPVIGIGGIDSWSEGRGSRNLHPLLARYMSQGRTVVMLYDSDGRQPDKVDAFDRSAGRFAAAVEAIGCRFRRAFVPAGPNGERQGIDDYLQAGATITDLRQLIEQATPAECCRTEVPLPGSSASNLKCIRQVADVLAPRRCLFFHAGEMVTLASTDAGTVVLEPLGPAAAASELEQHVQFTKCDRKDGVVPAPLTEPVARVILASPEFRRLMPHIRRVCDYVQPCFNDRGEIVLPQPGYDAALGTYTNPGAPTLEEFSGPEEAVSVLAEILGDFCFAEDEKYPDLFHVSALAYLLSGHCRLLIEPERCPIFYAAGNRPGVGKDELLGVAPVLMTGALPEFYPPTKDAEESRKRLFSIARSASRFYLVSNWRGHLSDTALESAATSPQIADRVLGASTSLRLANTAIYGISGNDLTHTEDFARRCIRISLACYSEDMDARRFAHPDLYAHILAHRPRYLGALQTLVVNWQRRGCPDGSRPKASFTRWASIVGGILEAADIFNPIGHDSAATEPTEEVVHLRQLLVAWHEQYGEVAIEPGTVRQLAMQLSLFAWIDMNDRSGQTRFAAVLKRHERRNFGGLAIRKQVAGRGHTTWSCGRAEE